MQHPLTSRAFTLIEILIVVVIMGILAAIVVPQFGTATDEASVNSCESQVATVRAQIELYELQNSGVKFTGTDFSQLTANEMYLKADPVNPFNNAVNIVTTIPVSAGSTDGWIWADPDGNTLNDFYAVDPDDSDGDGNYYIGQ